MIKDSCNSHGTMTSDNHAALWHGRFEQGPDAWAVEFETSIHVDERMAFDDINGSIAHARMLGETGILTTEESRRITDELAAIKNDLESGKITIDYSAEDIHSFIEAELTDRLGDTGRKLHTGRSRNDQIALDERLYLKRTIPNLCDRVCTLIEALSQTAEKHLNDLIPGYTHLQHAQPVTLAHHLCAWAWSLVRDLGRLQDALKRLDASPLGSGALAGSGLPLDRKSVADQLGFSEITDNSLDSVSDRDYCIELVSDFSLLQMHLSRFCEEIVLWSTTEFGFVDLSEKWSTGSSIMPQKKNPDFAELIRGRTGKIYGDLVSLLTMMKGLPLSYDRDLQEDKEPLFDALDCILGNVTVFTAMISSARWNTDRMAKGCRGGFLNATDVADYLVRKGMPFRTAHGVSAAAVRKAIELNCRLEELPLEKLQECSPLIGDDIYGLITPEACVAARKTDGGPAPRQVVKQIEALRQFCRTFRSAG